MFYRFRELVINYEIFGIWKPNPYDDLIIIYFIRRNHYDLQTLFFILLFALGHDNFTESVDQLR
jgi:hypothetical protein